MAYTLVFSTEAVKDIKKLDAVVKKRLQRKLIDFSKLNNVSPVAKKLVNYEAGQYRLRVGDYRVIFDLSSNTVHVLRVRHRRDVYR